MFGISELAILLIVVVLVLGARKLPELVRSAGRSTRILKREAHAMYDDDGTRPRVIQGTVEEKRDADPRD